MCDTMSSENSSPASSDASTECTMSVNVETEDVRLTVHMDIRTVSACIFNMCMHFKMSFAKNRVQHVGRIFPNAASHVRTQVQTKETLCSEQFYISYPLLSVHPPKSIERTCVTDNVNCNCI